MLEKTFPLLMCLLSPSKQELHIVKDFDKDSRDLANCLCKTSTSCQAFSLSPSPGKTIHFIPTPSHWVAQLQDDQLQTITTKPVVIHPGYSLAKFLQADPLCKKRAYILKKTIYI